MIVVVTGGREYQDARMVYETLDLLTQVREISLLVEGGARGADRLARSWAHSRQVTVETVAADWDRYGRAAGGIRNGWMLDRQPSIVVAFPGGTGTDNCKRQARQRRIPVYIAWRFF